MKSNFHLLFAIIVLGIVLRCYGLGAKSLWYDEAVSASSLRFTYTEIIARKASQASVHPPAYFLLLKGWATAFGDSEIALRSLAVVFGALAIPGMYLLAKRLCRLAGGTLNTASRVALWTALLTSVSPLHIINSQQVRGYSLGTALLAWSTWALLIAIYGPAHRQRVAWACWATMSVLLCYTSNLAVLSVVSQIALVGFLIIREELRGLLKPINAKSSTDEPVELEDPPPVNWRAQMRYAIACTIFLFCVYGLPWGSRIWLQAQTVRSTTTLVRPLSVEQVFSEVHRAAFASWAIQPSALGLERFIALPGILILIAWIATRRNRAGLVLVVMGLLPLLMMLVFSSVSNRSIIHARYLTFTQLMWLPAIPLTFLYRVSRLEQILVAVPLMLVGAYLCELGWRKLGHDHEDGIRGAVGYALENREKGELFLAAERQAFFGMSYYMRGKISPQLVSNESDRSLIRGGYEIKDTDIYLAGNLNRERAQGVWIFTTGRSTGQHRVDFTPSDSWELVDHKHFKQDFYWERPVSVSHYRWGEQGP